MTKAKVGKAKVPNSSKAAKAVAPLPKKKSEYGKVTSTDDARFKVRSYIADNKSSQKKFADLTGCSVTTLARFLTGNYHGVQCSGESSVAYHAIKRFFNGR